jgi:multidrug efflux pump subunit AcrA (membrane-fusion protein)
MRSCFPLLLFAVLGCHRADSAPNVAVDSATPTVKVVHPERRSISKTIELSGQIEGYEQSPVYAKIAGYVAKLNVDIGERVTKGQLLAELSIPEMLDELKQKEAIVGQMKSEVTQSQKMLRVADASVTRAEANLQVVEASRSRAESNYVRWKSEFDRYSQLVITKAVSAQEYEQTTNQFRSAEAARAETIAGVAAAKAQTLETEAQRDKAQADVEVAQSKLRVADADFARQTSMVGYAQIRAPFDRMITRRYLHVGHLLQPTGAQMQNGVPLYDVVRTDPVRVFVDVPEGDVALIRDESRATLVVPALQDREFHGTVKRSSWALDAQAHTLKVEIQAANPNGVLRPGMYVIGRIAGEAQGMMTIPASAIFVRDDETYVVRVEEGKALWTPVKTGRRQGDTVVLLRKMTQPPAADGRRTWEEINGEEAIVAEAPTAFLDGQVVKR